MDDGGGQGTDRDCQFLHEPVLRVEQDDDKGLLLFVDESVAVEIEYVFGAFDLTSCGDLSMKSLDELERGCEAKGLDWSEMVSQLRRRRSCEFLKAAEFIRQLSSFRPDEGFEEIFDNGRIMDVPVR